MSDYIGFQRGNLTYVRYSYGRDIHRNTRTKLSLKPYSREENILQKASKAFVRGEILLK